jgi:hypothetical protein
MASAGGLGRLGKKVAIITAAGSGIGRAIALQFAAEGADVVVNDLAPEEVRCRFAATRADRGDVVGNQRDFVLCGAGAAGHGGGDSGAMPEGLGWVGREGHPHPHGCGGPGGGKGDGRGGSRANGTD